MAEEGGLVPTWAELIARCPELMPAGLTYIPPEPFPDMPGRPAGVVPARWAINVGRCHDCGTKCDGGPGCGDILDDEHAYGLCRDRAVDWLAEQRPGLVIEGPYPDDAVWDIGSKTTWIACRTTRDEALRDAVAAVLELRGA